ncbi:MAG: hydratase [Clostridia bacterium]|nr:hydratase [Clostridia bacterium]
MITLKHNGHVWKNGVPVAAEGVVNTRAARNKTMAYKVMNAHNSSTDENLMRIKFDSLISHDITYVGIIQTARGSGLREFPVPYVMTNCHNSLCAVGGTINEDDHVFGLSAAKKYGGIYVPANQAVLHQYAREMMSGCGKMILGSDSHTRYGALGTMGVGEGGPEIVKQLLSNTYDVAAPEVVLVYLTGKPKQGVGPHDVAIALCGATYKNGFVKNKVLEFAGPGVKNLPMDYRIGIDVMTTETACLSSIWTTDERVEEYLTAHGRPDEYKAIAPDEGAYYDSVIEIDLSTVECMAALPFHPSEAYTVRELIAGGADLLREAEKRAEEQFGGKVHLSLTDKVQNGKIMIDQGVIAGCAGGMYDNIAEAAAIMRDRSVGNGYFSLSVYPPSVPVNLRLIKDGIQQQLLECGALFKPCFCGPCFGAGDVPSNNGLSIRHTTRNFPNREGSRPGDGQLSAVMLMDARSIAATAANGGVLTAATDIEYTAPEEKPLTFDAAPYEKRVYFGFGKADASAELRFGPNITEWPKIPALRENLMLRLASVIHDPVTTTDELIPSGETSSYRSNPLKLATFALSRRDPEYVARTADIRAEEQKRAEGTPDEKTIAVLKAAGFSEDVLSDTTVCSAVFANKPGDGSAREQAASCQRVLGGGANICYEYATKRYRSNCINWGMVPFTIDEGVEFDYKPFDTVFVPGIKTAIENAQTDIKGYVISDGAVKEITLHVAGLTEKEREILLSGCLMNWYAAQNK